MQKKKKAACEKALGELQKASDFFATTVQYNSKKPFRKTMQILRASGYTPIRVPGRLYYISLKYGQKHHDVNYMNGIVALNDRDELVYITNKALYDRNIGITPQIAKEIGFSIEKAFKNSISRYVKPNNIYFIEGAVGEIPNSLSNKVGGIHCLTAEIPVKD